MATFLLLFTTMLVFSSFCESSTSIAVVSKDQLDCTMCSSCDNPCQPIYSPPQPPPVSSHPPPSGGSGGGGVNYFSPPPPVLTSYYPPPYAGGGSYYPPSTPIGYGTPPPPNPIVPYFPFYYHTPPPPSAQQFQPDGSHSMKFKSQPPSISSLPIFFAFLLFL